MTVTQKLILGHLSIMAFIQSHIIYRIGELTEGWKKDNHIQHESDQLAGKIEIMKRIFSNFNPEIEDQGQLLKLKSFLERDLKKLHFDIQNDKIDERFFEPSKDYILVVNDIIDLLKTI